MASSMSRPRFHARLTYGDAFHTVKIGGKPGDDGIVGKDAPDKPEIGQNQGGNMDKRAKDIHLAHLDPALTGVAGIHRLDQFHRLIVLDEEKKDGHDAPREGPPGRRRAASPNVGPRSRRHRCRRRYRGE